MHSLAEPGVLSASPFGDRAAGHGRGSRSGCDSAEVLSARGLRRLRRDHGQHRRVSGIRCPGGGRSCYQSGIDGRRQDAEQQTRGRRGARCLLPPAGRHVASGRGIEHGRRCTEEVLRERRDSGAQRQDATRNAVAAELLPARVGWREIPVQRSAVPAASGTSPRRRCSLSPRQVAERMRAASIDAGPGMLEGIASIEAECYRRLQMLGAGAVRCVWTAGGGAENLKWMDMRRRSLGVPVEAAPFGLQQVHVRALDWQLLL